MPLFVKKPVVREASQFHASGDPEEYPEGVVWHEGRYCVRTAQGFLVKLADGDWVVTEPDGSGHYPCKDEIFRAEYDPKPE